MATTVTQIYLPDGQLVSLPIRAADTWTDEASGVAGTGLRAPQLMKNAAAATAWLRQRPLFQGIATAAQSIPNNAFTGITGLAELIDNWSGHTDTTNTGRWYAPYTNTGADWYLCSGYVPFSSTGATGAVFIAGMRINGAGTIQEGGRIPGGASHVTDTMVVDLVQLNGLNGDYVDLCAYQNTGAAVNTTVSGKTPSLTVRWVAPNHTLGLATPALPATPHTWADTDIVTGSATGAGKVPLNTELRDMANFLGNPPIARLTASGTTQTIPSSSTTWTSVNYTTVAVDNYTGWASANPSRYTAQRSGLYLIAGFVNVVENATNSGYRAVRLLVNGTNAYAGWGAIPEATGNTGTGIYAVGLLRLAAGDYVEVQMQQTQGSSIGLYTGAGNSSRLVAVWMAK